MVLCEKPKTRWDGTRCVTCIIHVLPGSEVTPNCGYDDDGNRHELPTRPCGDNTFNDGSGDHCRPCSTCPPGLRVVRGCSATADSLCGDPSYGTTAAPVTPNQGSTVPSTPHNNLTTMAITQSAVFWAVPTAVVVSIILIAVFAYIGNMKRKRGRQAAVGYNRRSSHTNLAFTSIDVEDILHQDILSAPLQTVLDNLDVLEELVILLDPENQGVKNTKHLASLCFFSSAWITYAYSMKDSKSPLRSVLEGVTCRDPDWTVGDLAMLLRRMERNDAVTALAKLRVEKNSCMTGNQEIEP